jgi:hypothetical protein
VWAAQVSPAPQAWLQAPQLAESLLRFTQLSLQSVKPTPQVIWHVRLAHTSPGEQAWPQAPQFWLSLAGSTQPPSHASSPVEHTVTHRLLTQLCPLVHAWLHEPQFWLSLETSMQPPLQATAGAAHPVLPPELELVNPELELVAELEDELEVVVLTLLEPPLPPAVVLLPELAPAVEVLAVALADEDDEVRDVVEPVVGDPVLELELLRPPL